MPRIQPSQTNFTAGEVSPRLMGRIDLQKYGNGAQTLLNAYPVIQGGAVSRPGTIFTAETKISAKRSRLIPFVRNRGNAYVVELGDKYAKFYNSDGSYTFGNEVVTPYTEAQIFDVDYARDADTMFLAHTAYPIQRLRRLTPQLWDWTTAPFVSAPVSEIGFRPQATGTLSAISVGTGRTLTASVGVFFDSDVGRSVKSAVGEGIIRSYTSATVVTIDITTAFADASGTVLASGAWKIGGSPQAPLTPSAKDPVSAAISLTLGTGVQFQAQVPITAGSFVGTNVFQVTATGHGYATNDVVLVFPGVQSGPPSEAYDSAAYPAQERIITVINANQYTFFESNASFAITAGAYGQRRQAASAQNGWRGTDVGKYVDVNGGLVKITRVDNGNVAQGTIVRALASTTTAPALSWRLLGPSWNAVDGYPRTVTIHQQRLIAAGSPGFPQTINGSEVGSYLDFTPGTDDSDSFEFTLSSEKNEIAFVDGGLRDLIVLTYGNEHSLRGGVEKPIAPTNVRHVSETKHGCAAVKPTAVRSDLLFVQSAGKKVRALNYRYDNDGYNAPDLIKLAEHLTGRADDGSQLSIVEIAYQQEPEGLLWAVRSDGKLLSCTLDRDPEVQVTGWALHDVGGFVESCCVVPNGAAETLFLLVRRTINGVTKRLIERIEMVTTSTDASAVNLAQLDCCVIQSDALGNSSWIHSTLPSTSLQVLADGFYLGSITSNPSGVVVLPRTAKSVQIGLPFEAVVVPVTPETGSGTGVSAGQAMSTSLITASFLNTGPVTVNDQPLSFAKFGAALLDKPIALFTGLEQLSSLGWEVGKSDITFRRSLPFPMHIRAVIRDFTVNS